MGKSRVGLEVSQAIIAPWWEASTFPVQGVGVPAVAAAVAQNRKHRGPQQQEDCQGPKEDSEKSSKSYAQMLTALSPGCVDGEGHTAVDRGNTVRSWEASTQPPFSSFQAGPEKVLHNRLGCPLRTEVNSSEA